MERCDAEKLHCLQSTWTVINNAKYVSSFSPKDPGSIFDFVATNFLYPFDNALGMQCNTFYLQDI